MGVKLHRGFESRPLRFRWFFGSTVPRLRTPSPLPGDFRSFRGSAKPRTSDRRARGVWVSYGFRATGATSTSLGFVSRAHRMYASALWRATSGLGIASAVRWYRGVTLYSSSMTGRIGTKGQVVIPKTLRDRAHLHPGDEVDFELRDQEIVLAARRSPARLGGRFSKTGMAMRLLEGRGRAPRGASCWPPGRVCPAGTVKRPLSLASRGCSRAGPWRAG